MPLRPTPLSVTDMALLGQLWQECRPRLLAMLRRRIDPSLAVRVDPEEVLSDTFLDAAADYPRFRAQAAITGFAWLYRLALDRLIETWRRETRGGTRPATAAGERRHGVPQAAFGSKSELERTR